MGERTILVTGGAGYIGSHTCKALAQAGYTPIAFDNLCQGHEWAVKWGPLIVGDILDRDALESAIAEHKPLAVIHFAAHAYVGESVNDPQKYYLVNVVGTLNLLEAMRKMGANRLVFSSSCSTFGIPDTVPIDEDAKQTPINPYGASKLMVERIMQDFKTAYGFQSIALRYFNAAGADPDGEIGEVHDPETHIIPLVLEAAAGVRPNVTIFGNDYPTPDGSCIRDYVHVSDLASAHVLALKHLEAGQGRSAYNLGMGSGISVHELINAAERVTGRSINVVIGPRRSGDPPVLLADARMAAAELGWQPQLSTVESIIETAWAWQLGRLSAPSDGLQGAPLNCKPTNLERADRL